MRRKFALLLLAAIASTMLVPASSLAHEHDPSGPCRGFIGGMHLAHNTPAGAIGVPVVSPGTIIPLTDRNRGPFYLDLRDLASDDYSFSIWLYQETNRVNGLQRGGRAIFPDTPATSGEEPCDEATNHDQAIF